MVIATIICSTIIICVLLVVIPTIQQQHYEYMTEMKKQDYALAQKQIELEKERVRYGE